MGTSGFAGNFRKNGAHCRVDVGIDPYGPDCDCDIEKTSSGWMAFFHGAGYGNTPAALPPPCRLGNCFDLRLKPSVFHTAAGLAPGIAGRSNHGFVAGPLQQKSAPIFEMGADFWQAAPIKISAAFLVFSMVSAFWGKVFGACCFILLVATVQPKKILWVLWNLVRSARFCQRSAF